MLKLPKMHHFSEGIPVAKRCMTLLSLYSKSFRLSRALSWDASPWDKGPWGWVSDLPFHLPALTPFNHPLWGLKCWTYYVLFSQGFIHTEPFTHTSALLESSCFLTGRSSRPSSLECTVLCRYWIGLIYFYYFICNHIHVCFPFRSLRAKSINCVFMYILPPIKPLKSMLHTVGTKLSRNFLKERNAGNQTFSYSTLPILWK